MEAAQLSRHQLTEKVTKRKKESLLVKGEKKVRSRSEQGSLFLFKFIGIMFVSLHKSSAYVLECRPLENR